MEQPDPPRPSPADAVLGVDYLLEEILLRLDFPAFLVLASQVNTFWRSCATDPAFLCLFRARLGCRPRPIGFYLGFVSRHSHDRTKFVTMSQRPDLAGVVSRANFGSFGDDPNPGRGAHALDCGNGRVLLNQLRYGDGPYVVLSPLDEPPAMAVLPPLRPPRDADRVLCFLRDDCGDQPCLVIGISSLPDKQKTLVGFSLSWAVDGTSCVSASAVYFAITHPVGQCLDKLLVHNKLYLLSSHGYIVRLDLASMMSLVIQLPDGVKPGTYWGTRTQLLSRADDSGVYFICVSSVQLYVWLCKTDGDRASIWVLEDRFSLYEAFGHLANLIWEADYETYDVVHLFGAGDNAEFVFLVDIADDYEQIFYLNIRTRKVEVVYNRLQEDGEVLDLCPFMMV